MKKDDPNWWKEKADPTPVEVPAELKKPESMDDRIRRIIREQISPMAARLGEETFEESEDFDVDDGFDVDDPITPYEAKLMVSEFPAPQGLQTPQENAVEGSGEPLSGTSEPGEYQDKGKSEVVEPTTNKEA